MGDYIIPPPPNPGAGADAVWFDTGDGGMPNMSGIVGELLADQAVTLFIESAPLGGSLIVTNGAGQVIAPNTLELVAVRFRGARTRLRVRTGPTPPSATGWHLNARLLLIWLP